ncbi:MAG: NAD+ synthase [Alphaproteobacteria bacterium]|nr:NAD+ synthase [Alphaproteobacteria bacterium]
MKIFACQLNPTVGDLKGNAAKIAAAYARGVNFGADVVIFPEMMLTGYLPGDLLFSEDFLVALDIEVNKLVRDTTEDTALILSVPHRVGRHTTHATTGLVDKPPTFNSALFCAGGKVLSIHGKEHLFNYSVADEKRVFAPYRGHAPQLWKGVSIGIPICRDVWYSDVSDKLKAAGAEILLSPNGSPYFSGKHESRVQIMQNRVAETGCPALYLNLVGGQDDYIFDGCSFALSTDETKPTAQFAAWEEEEQLLVLEHGHLKGAHTPLPKNKWEDISHAMVMGLKDYCHKNGFTKATLGLSGGVDSALVAALAAEALGAENVTGLLMPSDYSSSHSVDDANALAKNLGIHTHTLPIQALKGAFDTTWEGTFSEKPSGLTEQNLQARLRGSLVMAFTNANASTLALTTGNKSEVAVGYCTLYGDMNGGYNPIKDLYKTEVFELCAWINRDKEIIPHNILSKAPSAELAPDQKDSDSLPDYNVLDAVLKLAIEQNIWSAETIAKQTGANTQVVKDILRLIRINEYKRYQAAPGPKLSKIAFGVDRRYPLTNKFSL